MNPILLFLLMSLGGGIVEVDGGFFIPHDEMSNLVAYVEKVEAENDVYVQHIKMQENTIQMMEIEMESLRRDDGCVFWQVGFGITGSALVGIIIYGLVAK